MVRMTSAYANKLLKQLSEDKDFWMDKEKKACLYTATVGETPVIPEYDYGTVAATLAEIDRKVSNIKHAINVANVTNQVEINGQMLSIDTILVRMAQMNKRKSFLDFMRKQQPEARVEQIAYSRTVMPEYRYINYDLELIKQEYEKYSLEIMNMQMALDRFNQTYEFEVDI